MAYLFYHLYNHQKLQHYKCIKASRITFFLASHDLTESPPLSTSTPASITAMFVVSPRVITSECSALLFKFRVKVLVMWMWKRTDLVLKICTYAEMWCYMAVKASIHPWLFSYLHISLLQSGHSDSHEYTVLLKLKCVCTFKGSELMGLLQSLCPLGDLY